MSTPWTKVSRLQAELETLWARHKRLTKAATDYRVATGHRAPFWLGDLHLRVFLDVARAEGYLQAQIDELEKYRMGWAA